MGSNFINILWKSF